MGQANKRGNLKLINVAAESKQILSQRPLPATELRHFRNVISSVMQDALNTWADLWGELQDGVAHGAMVKPEAEKGFKPSCGWPEFLEKMWVLKHYLDFAKRFSRQ